MITYHAYMITLEVMKTFHSEFFNQQLNTDSMRRMSTVNIGIKIVTQLTRPVAMANDIRLFYELLPQSGGQSCTGPIYAGFGPSDYLNLY